MSTIVKWVIELTLSPTPLYLSEDGGTCGNINHAMKWNTKEGAEAYASGMRTPWRVAEHAWCPA